MVEVRDESIHYFERAFPAVPELALIGHATFSKASRELVEHDHGPALEVLALSRGKQAFVADGQEYTMRGGGCVIFPAGVVHSTGGHPQGKADLRWIQIDVGLQTPFFGNANHEPLRDSLRGLATQAADLPQDLWNALRRLYEITNGSDSPTRDSHVAALSLAFCHRLLEIAAAPAKRRLTPAIEHALAFMNSHLKQALSVAQMAKSCGYAESAFNAAFKREIGLAPAEHFLRAKLELAGMLLRGTNKTITTISNELGFSSTQYFATAFKRHHMSSPTEWRRRD